MIIDYEGKQYPYDPEDLDVEQALRIEKHIDGPMIEYEKGLAVASAKCYQVLGWLIFNGGDPAVPIASVNFKFAKLAKAFEAAAEAETTAEAEAIAKAAAPAGPTGRAAASSGRKSGPASSPSA